MCGLARLMAELTVAGTASGFHGFPFYFPAPDGTGKTVTVGKDKQKTDLKALRWKKHPIYVYDCSYHPH